MGLKGSKPKLSKEDLEFLKKNTNFTEEQIKEWYKGFVVSNRVLSYVSRPDTKSCIICLTCAKMIPVCTKGSILVLLRLDG